VTPFLRYRFPALQEGCAGSVAFLIRQPWRTNAHLLLLLLLLL
jgi:hypothetical protein